jgi:transposase
VTETIHQALETKDMLPSQHLRDGGYVDAQNLVNSQSLDIQLISPVRSDSSWQAHAAQGFDVAHFAIDWDQQQATCPQGQVSTKWQPPFNRMGEDIIHVRFAKAACLACPLRTACTKAAVEPRELTLFPYPHHMALQAARQFQETPLFKQLYNARSGIEGTFSQSLRVHDLRHARYIGLAKTHLQHIFIALAINVARALAWLSGLKLAQTRTSHFAELAPS